jgi:hypothetical protein
MLDMHRPIYFFCIIIAAQLIFCGCATEHNLEFTKTEDGLIVEGSKLRVDFQAKDSLYEQVFYMKASDQDYVEVMRSYNPAVDIAEHSPSDTNYARLYNARISAKRYLINEQPSILTYDKKSGVVTLQGGGDGFNYTQSVTFFPEENRIHYKVECMLPDPSLDYVMSTFAYNCDQPPYFVHTPALKYDNEDSQQNRFRIVPSQDQIIGDRSFYAPAIILQEENMFAALVPDLNAINAHRVVSPDARRTSFIPRNKFGVAIEEERYTMPTFLDLNVKSGLTSKPILAYGYGDAVIGHHMHYNRFNDSTMVRNIDGDTLIYEFDLILAADAEGYGKYADVGQFIWSKYGKEVFENHPHLPMPFDEYRRIIDSITFRPSPYPDIDIPVPGYENTGSWLQWEDNGVPMGGYRSAINWWNDKLHNSQFWNNARDALGFWFWGTEHNDSVSIDRAHRIINWCLSAPQNDAGLFATLYNAEDKTWALQFSDPMHGQNRYFLEDSKSYDVAAMSKTGAHLLDYYMRCEADERIVDYLEPYADWLVSSIDERGSVPAYVSDEMEFSEILRYSGHPSASLWFLANMYHATANADYLAGAKKIAAYLEKEVLPEARWIDQEQYFSCGAKPLSFTRDIVQNQVARGNLTVIWACEGFASLYEATGSEQYLRDGALCIDYLSFTQCSWNPHYVYTAIPFGGFGVDNSDVTSFLDARQAETVRPFIWYGKALGRQDLLERGVAAARSSIVLINHPKHQSNDIYKYVNIYPYGLGPENIDHEGYPQSAMRTHPSWGEGSGVYTGLAEARRNLGGLYVNTDKRLATGVDGLKINAVSYEDDHVVIEAESWLTEKHLSDPWNTAYHTTLVVEGSPDYILLNDEKIIFDQEIIPLEVFPGKYIRRLKTTP